MFLDFIETCIIMHPCSPMQPWKAVHLLWFHEFCAPLLPYIHVSVKSCALLIGSHFITHLGIIFYSWFHAPLNTYVSVCLTTYPCSTVEPCNTTHPHATAFVFPWAWMKKQIHLDLMWFNAGSHEKAHLGEQKGTMQTCVWEAFNAMTECCAGRPGTAVHGNTVMGGWTRPDEALTHGGAQLSDGTQSHYDSFKTCTDFFSNEAHCRKPIHLENTKRVSATPRTS